MASENLPAHTFSETDLMLAGDALRIVDGMVRRALGDTVGDAAVARLNDLAADLRDQEKATAERPDVACNWPWEESEGVPGEMSFHVASGGTEYDGITAHWTRGEGERLLLTYSYDGRDELYDEGPSDEDEAERDGP